jgi:raffinose/stachyose/melibiose transport system substrate-binding protein
MKIPRMVSRIAAAALFLAAGSLFGQNLTLGSWRTDDVAKVSNIIAAFNKSYPNIKVKFDPTNPPDYNATLRLQLESGNGPDLFYARSYATGAELFKAGFELDLTTLPAIKSNFTPSAVSAWTTPDGKVFAMPLGAVSHGIYYNKDIFAKYGIAIPKTWEALMAAADKLKKAGITPFANGVADQWDINEVVMMNILPSAVGGAEGRLAYESGKRPFNDAAIVGAFQQIKDLAPYLPKGFEALTYNDAQALFALGKAAMYFDGSWTVPQFIDQAKDIHWSVFSTPPAKGKKPVVEFHPDSAIAINPASKNIEAAKTFLTWLSGPLGAKAIGDNLIGVFPMSKNAVKLENEYANTFLSFNKGAGQDARFVWPKLMVGKPSGYDLLQNNTISVLKGEETPQAAADAFAAGLAQWYKPGV